MPQRRRRQFGFYAGVARRYFFLAEPDAEGKPHWIRTDKFGDAEITSGGATDLYVAKLKAE